MMKNYIFLILICFFSTGHILSQNLSIVASNPAGDNHVIHTLKLSNTSSSLAIQNDDSATISTDKKNQEFISLIEQKNGVQRITFDNATSTFTVLSDKSFNITTIINSYNSSKK
jgi:uncharacterized protein (UPF0333 family)